MPFINLKIYSIAHCLKYRHSQRLLQHTLNASSLQDRFVQSKCIWIHNFDAWNLNRELLELKVIMQFQVQHLGCKNQ